MVQYFPSITGSLTVNGNLIISGSISTSGSITISGSVASASYAATLEGLGSASFAPAATFNIVSSSYASASGSLSTRVTNLEVTTSVVSSSFATTSGSLSSRVSIIEGQDATTGSNTFTGVQYVSQASNAISFTSTASLYTDGGLRVAKDSFVSGTAYFNNITVYGTSSIQYITSSQVNIGANIITVNTDTPAVRFGGLAVFDSGSTQLTGSMLWDSQNNHWVYSNPSGSSYSGGMIMSGPRSSALGSEQGTLNNFVMKGQGGDHITSSQIIDDGTTVRIPGNLQVTGSTILSNALSGISATFSGTLAVGLTSGYSNGVTIKGASDDYALTIAQSNSSTAGWGMWADTGGNFKLSRYGTTYGSPALTITLAGLATFSQAATFSSSITTGDQIRITGTTAQALYLFGAAGVKPYITLNEFGVRDWEIGVGTTASGKLSITSTLGGTDGITIDGSGNVSIGDANASANLWVNNSGAGNLFGVRNTNASFAATIGFFGADRNTTNNSFYYIDCYNYGSGTYRFRVADNGNVTSAGRMSIRGGTDQGGYYMDYQSDASSRSFRVSSEHLVFGDFVIQKSTTRTGTTYEDLLYFNASKAATFSNSVTVTNSLTLSNPTTYTGKYTSDAVTVAGGAPGGGGGTITIGDSSYVGLLIVSISTQNCVGIFLISSSTQVLLVSQTTTETRFSTTAGNLNTANIYFSGNNLILQNNIQATRNFRMNFIGKIE